VHIPEVYWPKRLAEAQDIQKNLQHKILIHPLKETLHYVAAVDAAFTQDQIVAVVVLYAYPELKLLEQGHVREPVLFPYVPGYLTFREGHGLLKAIGQLKTVPDLILFDGQGIAHPRGTGIASHLGVLLDIPSIGVAKTRLVGNYEEPGQQKGNCTDLCYAGKVVGAVLRTKPWVRPLFVSPGHRIDIADAVKVVLGCTQKYRLPEPLRKADYLTKVLKKSGSA